MSGNLVQKILEFDKVNRSRFIGDAILYVSENYSDNWDITTKINSNDVIFYLGRYELGQRTHMLRYTVDLGSISDTRVISFNLLTLEYQNTRMDKFAKTLDDLQHDYIMRMQEFNNG